MTRSPDPIPLPDGVKRTSGGTFRPSDPYLYFLAASSITELYNSEHPTVLAAANELDSQVERDRLDRLIDDGRRVLLDSGIFNLTMTHVRSHPGITMDDALKLAPEEIDGFDRLWDTYAEVASSYADRLWGVIELDQGGREHKPITRARIESEIGITPMPVYHPLVDGWDYYDEIAAGYDRICFGNIVQAAPSVRLRLAHTAYERGRQYPYLWTHLLGLTPNQNTHGLRMRGSCDSSSWLAPLRWPPSWKGWAGLQMVTGYPPSMWAHSATNAEGYTRDKQMAICAQTARAVQTTVNDCAADTHPVLTFGEQT